MPTIDMNDTTLYYERSGKGPAMLFVHGMCGDAEVWPTRPYASPTATPACATTGEATAAAAEATPPSATPCTPTTPPPSSRLSGWRRACWSDPAAAAIAVDVALRYGHLLRGAVFSEPPLFCLDPAAGQAIMEELTRRLAQAPRRADPAADVDGFFSLVCPRLWSMLRRPARTATAPTPTSGSPTCSHRPSTSQPTTWPRSPSRRSSSPATPATPRSDRSPTGWPKPCPTPGSSSSPTAATSPRPSSPTPSPTPSQVRRRARPACSDTVIGERP